MTNICFKTLHRLFCNSFNDYISSKNFYISFDSNRFIEERWKEIVDNHEFHSLDPSESGRAYGILYVQKFYDYWYSPF